MVKWRFDATLGDDRGRVGHARACGDGDGRNGRVWLVRVGLVIGRHGGRRLGHWAGQLLDGGGGNKRVDALSEGWTELTARRFACMGRFVCIFELLLDQLLMHLLLLKHQVLDRQRLLQHVFASFLEFRRRRRWGEAKLNARLILDWHLSKIRRARYWLNSNNHSLPRVLFRFWSLLLRIFVSKHNCWNKPP